MSAKTPLVIGRSGQVVEAASGDVDKKVRHLQRDAPPVIAIITSHTAATSPPKWLCMVPMSYTWVWCTFSIKCHCVFGATGQFPSQSQTKTWSTDMLRKHQLGPMTLRTASLAWYMHCFELWCEVQLCAETPAHCRYHTASRECTGWDATFIFQQTLLQALSIWRMPSRYAVITPFLATHYFTVSPGYIRLFTNH